MSFYNEQGEPTIQILDHGVVISNDPSSINFTGAGVTVSILGQDITVDIPGGGTGGVSSVTGSLVDNTDPANPVVSIGQGTVNTLPLVASVDGSNNIVTLADSLVSSNGISTLVTQPSFTYSFSAPVYDLASSDPGFTPNGQRYIDTTDWNFCGIGSIVSSDGNGLYNCDQSASFGMTEYLTNQNKFYTFDGTQWILGNNGVLELTNDTGTSSIFLRDTSPSEPDSVYGQKQDATKGSLAIDLNTANLWIKNDSPALGITQWLSMVKSSNYGGNTTGTTSPVYDLASSDPGATPNGRRYIDTTDWSGCGVAAIVSSDGGGSYNCDQTPTPGLTVNVTNQNLMYQWNGLEWTNGIVSPAVGFNSDVQGTDGYGNFKVNHYNTSLPSLSIDGQNNGATAFVSFNIQKSYTDNTINQNLAIDNLTAPRTIQFPDVDGNITVSVNGVAANNLGEITIPVGTGDISGTGTTNEIAYFTGASTIASLSTGTYPSLTELSYVKGVTSAIQTQLGNKLSLSGGTMTGNISITNLTGGYTSIATAAGTTTLTVNSNYYQVFTGSTTQTVVLPNATTLNVGHRFYIDNNSTGIVTVQTNGGATLTTIAGNTDTFVICSDVSTSAGVWDVDTQATRVTGGKIFTVNNSITLSGTDATTITMPTATSTLLANNLGISGGTTYLSGTAATDKTIFQTTSGNQTVAVTNLYTYKSGNNGSQELLRIGDGPTGNTGELGMHAAGQSSTSNFMIRAGTNFTYLNAGTDLRLLVGGVNYITMSSGNGTVNVQRNLQIIMPASTGTLNPSFLITGAAHTALTASTEYSDVNWNLARTLQFATGAITTQRAVRIQAPTYSAVGASTFTNVYGLYVDTPIAGTNVTITNRYTAGFQNSIIVGSGTTGIVLRDDTGTYTALYNANVTPSSSNYFLKNNSSTTLLNALTGGSLFLAYNGSGVLQVTSATNIAITDTANITFSGTTGSKLGTATTQKIGFWNATPIVQPANTVAIDTLLVNTGLRATGGDANFDTAIVNSLPLRLKGYTVATLPAGTVGDTAYVTDALAPTFLATIVGGGAVTTPVFFNGTNWVGY